jgi:peroxiredoxin
VPPILLALALAASPDGPAVTAPRLARGDELVYRGEVTEASERIGNRFRKVSDLEVRVLVLAAEKETADCAVITKVRSKADPVVAGAVTAVTGTKAEKFAAAVRVELVRVDARGRCTLLAPKAGPPPVPLGPDTPTRPAPPLPLDAPPVLELGMFVPLPVKTVKAGDQWDAPDGDRPPVGWWAIKEAIWNGSRCVELHVAQQTDGYAKPDVAPTGWRRREAVLAAPTDGYACAVRRVIEKREGKDVVGWVDVKFELQPTQRYVGGRFADVRREAEAAYCFAVEFAHLQSKPKTEPVDYLARMGKIDRFVEDYPAAGGFRDAIAAVRRRCESAANGEAIPSAAVITASYTARPEPPELGKPAPDFVAPRLGGGTDPFRLGGAKGKPVVLVFFKPEVDLSAASLRVTEALHKKYAGKVEVVALAVGADAAGGGKRQKDDLLLTVPVLDGTAVRERYTIDSFPRFFVVDPTGNLAFQFEGYGNETVGLIRKQVEGMLK